MHHSGPAWIICPEICNLNDHADGPCFDTVLGTNKQYKSTFGGMD